LASELPNRRQSCRIGGAGPSAGHADGPGKLPASVVPQRAKDLLEFAQPSDKAERPVASLSGGMRRRLKD
jgi:hypothetical protein